MGLRLRAGVLATKERTDERKNRCVVEEGAREKEREEERGERESETAGSRMIEQGAMLGRRCTNSVGRRGPHQPRSPG